MSTTVSNPYSFNIVNNTSFTSPTIQSNLPQTDTLLADISDTYDKNYHLTIPTGVNAIYCSGYVEAGSESYASYKTTLMIKNNANNKYWNKDSKSDSGKSSVFVSCQRYIGVTPGKTYDLFIDTSATYELYYGNLGYKSSDVKIYYSASINNHAIDVEDY